jgi:predicted alpha/beta superfamily hydrolase
MRLGVLGCLLALTASAPSAKADDKISPAEATIPNTRIIRFTSVIDKQPYAIQVSIPAFAPRPKAGWPILYVLDGEIYFPEAAMISDFQGASAAVVVGIGHGVLNDKVVAAHYAMPGDPKPADSITALHGFQARRDYDFKWPVSAAHRAPAFVRAAIGPETGDVDDFLQVIEKEIKPRVEALVPINRGNQALFGHSSGGLAVVRAMFTEPAAFRTFVPASPAIWYDGGAVLADEKKFAADVTGGRVAPRVLVTVGSLEPEDVGPSKDDLASMTPAQRTAIAPYAKMRSTWPGMITGARELAARLKALHGKPGYKVEFALFEGETHPSSAYVALGRAIRFAFEEK